MDTADLLSWTERMAAEPRLALDTESDAFHRYHEKVCLIQLSTPSADYLFDPLRAGLPDSMRRLLEADSTCLVLHGADFDVRSLKKSFGLGLGPLFDTFLAASLTGARELGLKALLKTELGVEIQKGEQRSDWARRPLSEAQRHYARQDTRYLLPLAEILEGRLRQLGRLAWLDEECARVRAVEPSRRVFDPEGYRRIKGVGALPEVGQAALRAIYVWREETAEKLDRAPFRVLTNEAMLRLADELGRRWLGALRAVRTADAAEAGRKLARTGLPGCRPDSLRGLHWLPRGLDHAALAAALERGFEGVLSSMACQRTQAGQGDQDQEADQEQQGQGQGQGHGQGRREGEEEVGAEPWRPAPDGRKPDTTSIHELEVPCGGPESSASGDKDFQDPEPEAIHRLLTARQAESKRLGLDPGFFLSSALLRRVARARPQDLDGLLAVEGLTRWRVEAAGAALIQALR